MLQHFSTMTRRPQISGPRRWVMILSRWQWYRPGSNESASRILHNLEQQSRERVLTCRRKCKSGSGLCLRFQWSLHQMMTQSRENSHPLLKPRFHRWYLQIVSGTCQTPCACGTEISYGTFSSGTGGFMEKPPKFLQAQWFRDSGLLA
jgi:hypothetical protein